MIYWVVFPASQSNPTATEIAAQTVPNGIYGTDALPADSGVMLGDEITGLTPDTAYKLAATWFDGTQYSNKWVSDWFLTTGGFVPSVDYYASIFNDGGWVAAGTIVAQITGTNTVVFGASLNSSVRQDVEQAVSVAAGDEAFVVIRMKATTAAATFPVTIQLQENGGAYANQISEVVQINDAMQTYVVRGTVTTTLPTAFVKLRNDEEVEKSIEIASVAVWRGISATPPVVQSGQSFNTIETADVGAVVGNVLLSSGAATAFSITSITCTPITGSTVSTPGVFAINNAGELRLDDGNSLDYETVSLYTVTVEASSTAGSGSAAVTVRPSDAGTAIISGATFSIVNGSPIGTDVGRVSTTGDDPVGFSILSSQAYGANLVTNGTFDTDLSDWTSQDDQFVWNAGRAEHLLTDLLRKLWRPVTFNVGEQIRFEFDYEVIQGTMRAQYRTFDGQLPKDASGSSIQFTGIGHGVVDVTITAATDDYAGVMFGRHFAGDPTHFFVDNVRVRKLTDTTGAFAIDAGGDITTATAVSDDTAYQLDVQVTDGTTPVSEVAGVLVSSLSNTPPVVVTASVPVGGTELVLVFDRDIQGTAGMVATVGGINAPLSSPVIVGSTLTYSLPTVYANETVELSYTGTAISSLTGAPLVPFSNRSVVNGSVQIVGEPTVDWLEDQPVSRITNMLSTTISEKMPLKCTGSIKQTMTRDQLASFDIACAKIFSDAQMANAQIVNPSMVYLRIICPQEYQAWTEQPGRTGQGIPFDSVGPVTNGTGDMFPGHWAFYPYATLTQGIGTGATTFSVSDANRLTVGQYACIRNADWSKGEHVRVTGRNLTTNTVTVVRGQPAGNQGTANKSTALSFNSGDFIAQHQLGNGGGDSRNWVYNLSTACPTDGAGKRFFECWADEVASWYDKTATGGTPASLISGILFDSDFYYFMLGGGWAVRSCDFDNDGVADGGLDLATGVNIWGEGMLAMAQRLRTKITARGGQHTNVIIWIGDSNNPLIEGACNSGQLEAFPNGVYAENGTQAPTGVYKISHYFSCMKCQMYGDTGPIVGDVQNKAAQLAYPSGSGETSNHDFRLGFGLQNMGGHAGSLQNYDPDNNGPLTEEPFRHMEEYAVCTVEGGFGGYQYGQCIPRTDPVGVRTHAHWMGLPLGQYRRVYDASQKTDADSLLKNDDPDFLNAQIAWSGGQGADVTHAGGNSYNGIGGSLKITMPNPTGITPITGTATGPYVALSNGSDYTFCFATKAVQPRHITVTIGGRDELFWVPSGWTKNVFGFRAANNGSNIVFSIGGDGSDIFIDQLRLFTGDSNVMRRDFENAVVVVNATKTPIFGYDLGDTLQRLNGTQDVVNDGTTVSAVDIPAYDAAILVRQAGAARQATPRGLAHEHTLNASTLVPGTVPLVTDGVTHAQTQSTPAVAGGSSVASDGMAQLQVEQQTALSSGGNISPDVVPQVQAIGFAPDLVEDPGFTDGVGALVIGYNPQNGAYTWEPGKVTLVSITGGHSAMVYPVNTATGKAYEVVLSIGETDGTTFSKADSFPWLNVNVVQFAAVGGAGSNQVLSGTFVATAEISNIFVTGVNTLDAITEMLGLSVREVQGLDMVAESPLSPVGLDHLHAVDDADVTGNTPTTPDALAHEHAVGGGIVLGAATWITPDSETQQQPIQSPEVTAHSPLLTDHLIHIDTLMHSGDMFGAFSTIELPWVQVAPMVYSVDGTQSVSAMLEDDDIFTVGNTYSLSFIVDGHTGAGAGAGDYLQVLWGAQDWGLEPNAVALPDGAVYARPAEADIVDYEGITRTLPVDVPRFDGARIAQNLAEPIFAWDAFVDATNDNGAVSFTQNGSVISMNRDVESGRDYVMTMDIEVTSGGGPVRMTANAPWGSGKRDFTLVNGERKRWHVHIQSTSNVSDASFQISNRSAAAIDFIVHSAQLEDTTGAVDPSLPSEYVSTLGPELVANGAFDADVSGWDVTYRSPSFSWDSGKIIVTNTGAGGPYPSVAQAIQTKIGTKYSFSGQITQVDEIGFLLKSDDASYSTNQVYAINSAVVPTTGGSTFIATASITYTHLVLGANQGSNTYDNISVREVYSGAQSFNTTNPCQVDASGAVTEDAPTTPITGINLLVEDGVETLTVPGYDDGYNEAFSQIDADGTYTVTAPASTPALQITAYGNAAATLYLQSLSIVRDDLLSSSTFVGLDDMTQDETVVEGSLLSSGVVLIDAIEQTQQLSTPLVAAHTAIDVDQVTHLHHALQAQLVAANILAPADLSHTHTLPDVGLVPFGTIDVDSMLQVHQVVVAELHPLSLISVASLAHEATVAQAVLVADQSVSVDNIQQLVDVGAAVLYPSGVVQSDDVEQVQTMDAPSVEAYTALTVHDVVQAQVNGQSTLVTAAFLNPEELEQIQIVENVSVFVSGALVRVERLYLLDASRVYYIVR